jgi:putative sigma-54 modulation protein
MNISIVGRHVDLSDSIKSHLESGLEALTKFNLDIISVRTILSSDEKRGKKSLSAELTLNIAHRNSIAVKTKDKDLYVAIDTAISKAQKVLRREHDKVTDTKREGLEESTFKHITSKEDSDDIVEDEIIPMELELYKPMEIAEALDRLKDSNKQFYPFYDHDDKLRIIYKVEENRYGLY